MVNVGAMLSKLRSDWYASKLYRVMFTDPMDRYGVVVFSGGNLDCSRKNMDRNQKNEEGRLMLEEYNSRVTNSCGSLNNKLRLGLGRHLQ